MSESSNQDRLVRDLTTAVQNLSLAAQTLSRHVVSAPSPAVVPEGWEVVEEETAPYPTLAEKLRVESSCRGAEEGPLETPPACLDLARRRLTSVSIGAEARAHRAFQAGFWAKVAIDSHTPYVCQESLPELKISHWIVLSSSKHSSPFRVCSRKSFEELTRGSEGIVVERFASLAEVQIFCLGAQAPVPQLLSCRKQT